MENLTLDVLKALAKAYRKEAAHAQSMEAKVLKEIKRRNRESKSLLEPAQKTVVIDGLQN